MTTRSKVISNFYRDSVSLMQLSARIGALPGVDGASAVMATEANLALAEDAGLLDARPDAGPNDLLIVVSGNADALDMALDEAVAALQSPPTGAGAGRRIAPRSIAMAVAETKGANLALISTPGEFAVAEAMKALTLGLNVMIFSDNVALEDEIALKDFAGAQGLMVMGPDCGTAIVDDAPLGFANEIRRGDIGVVAASGTGLQQVTCLIDRAGRGISQAIGTGGRDLHEKVGGATMLAGIAALAADPDTSVIVLVSKPPAPAVAARVLDAASETGKPVVVNFLGADPATLARDNVTAVATLADAAATACALSAGHAPASLPAAVDPASFGAAGGLQSGRRYLRALYSGGTFCYEALVLLSPVLGPVRSSTPLRPADALADPWKSEGHTAIDLGDDSFTRGRAHPMIDHRLRNDRILQEAADAETAVILFDVVLGHGAHPDPAAEMIPVIRRARAHGGAVFVASVCGTASDPQDLARQEAVLADAGVLLADSNAAAVRLAAAIIAAGEAAAS